MIKFHFSLGFDRHEVFTVILCMFTVLSLSTAEPEWQATAMVSVSAPPRTTLCQMPIKSSIHLLTMLLIQ